MYKKIIALGLLVLTSQVNASGGGLSIQSVYYCGDDFLNGDE